MEKRDLEDRQTPEIGLKIIKLRYFLLAEIFFVYCMNRQMDHMNNQPLKPGDIYHLIQILIYKPGFTAGGSDEI